MNSPLLTNTPDPLEHFTVTIKDAKTLIVVGHFIEREEGFEDCLTAHFMTVDLTRPITEMNELAKARHPLCEACELSEFYSDVPEELHAEILTIQGKNPDEEFAKWAADDGDATSNLRLIEWHRVEDKLPESFTDVLIFHPDNISVLRAGYFYTSEIGNGWSSENHETVEVTHWAEIPEPPTVVE